MTADAFQRALAALCGRRPFRPFAVALDDGTRLEIDQPHALHVRRGVAVFLPPTGGPVWFDHASVVRISDERSGEERAAA